VLGLAACGEDKNASAASARVTTPPRIAATPRPRGLLLHLVTATGVWAAGC
jgi:hypothetical protein